MDTNTAENAIYRRYSHVVRFNHSHERSIRMTAFDLQIPEQLVRDVVDKKTSPLFFEDTAAKWIDLFNIKKLPKIP